MPWEVVDWYMATTYCAWPGRGSGARGRHSRRDIRYDIRLTTPQRVPCRRSAVRIGKNQTCRTDAIVPSNHCPVMHRMRSPRPLGPSVGRCLRRNGHGHYNSGSIWCLSHHVNYIVYWTNFGKSNKNKININLKYSESEKIPWWNAKIRVSDQNVAI